jgi:hypothetical protein
LNELKPSYHECFFIEKEVAITKIVLSEEEDENAKLFKFSE